MVACVSRESCHKDKHDPSLQGIKTVAELCETLYGKIALRCSM